MEDALKKLDKLTQEEARMATAEVLRATHTINEGVRVVKEQVAEVIDGTQIIFSHRLRNAQQERKQRES
jgi:hypothetical protein